MRESIEINEGNGELKMREINFRAWDLGAEQMYDWESIKLHFSEHIDHEMVVVMQYTGLKDVHGTEIYEGDIVHMHSVMPGCDIDEKGIVKFIECAFLFEKTDGSDGWSIFNEATEIEVIGNIYENPVLIKTK